MKGDAAPADTYDLVTVVWGPEFIDLFLTFCVPNQLTPGNLAALPEGARYRVVTKPGDVGRLADSSALDAVRRVLPVDVVAVDTSEFDAHDKPDQIANRYRTMTACHRRAIADAAARRAALIFLAPDFVMADGTMAALVRLHRAGKRAVLSPNLRLARYSFVKAMTARGVEHSLPPRELVRLAMGHLHPSTESQMPDAQTANDYPGGVFWPVRSRTGELDGLVVRSLSMHPLLLDLVRRDKLPRNTIDGAYLMRCGPPLDQCYVVDDSDEIAVFELTPEDRVIGTRGAGRATRLLRLAAVAGNGDAYQLSHWQRSVRLHASDLDARWTEAEAQCAAVVRRVNRLRPYGPLLFRTFRRLSLWRQRRERWARAARRAMRPYVDGKRVLRPVKVVAHRVSRGARLAMKRVRRMGTRVKTA